MPRLRLGVAVVVPEPVAGEVDVLRRACGDPAWGRIAPHLTLVPPVNVAEDRLEDALAVLRGAAAQVPSFAVTLGPPTTFLPANPVLYLAVGGDVEALRRLRDAVFAEPLARSLTWPFHPHVTVVDSGEPPRLVAATEALAGYRAEVVVERVHLLQERRDEGGQRVWRPVADAHLGPPAVVGRGGLALELATSGQLDPLAGRFRDGEWAALGSEPPSPGEGLAVTGRRDGQVVGAIEGRIDSEGGEVADLIVAAAHRGEGIGRHLVAAFVAAVAERGCRLVRVRSPAPAAGFWRHLGWTDEAVVACRPTVDLRRDLP
ncbi:MAG TPA: GNAT family N-acetyltransferase [Acidimicrobiales bacterium]|nr:GNAT family N-acetyltransferase [Acidimicrobiales bacterium]